ncbi:MAG: J domain-containing protein [Deltaproteobacteria bacterium]|nr:J domain-containing protein [Deltaproteobacteria bacterium]
MDIRRCFEILELDRNASPDEAKQAYKDIVNIWHPDRFSHNPRLKQKAEAKLKKVNVAYETVQSFLSKKQTAQPEQKAAQQPQAGPKPRDRTEAAVEEGTRMVLEVSSYLYKTLRRMVVSQSSGTNPEAEVKKGGEKRRDRGKGKGRG